MLFCLTIVKGLPGMGIKERKEQEKQELKNKILDAAKEILFEKGIDKLSMRMIASRINYSPTTIYLYFKNKEELTRSLMEYAFEQLVIALMSVDRSSFADDPFSILKEGLRLYIKHGVSNSHFYRMMTTSILGRSENSIALKKGTINEQAFLILEQGVKNCIDAGVIEAAEPRTTAKMLWAAIHGLTMLLIDVPHFPWGDQEKLINHYVDMLVNKI